MSKLKSKHRGIEQIKSRYGLLFVLPWFIGFIIFFALPLIQSVIYSFSEITIVDGGVETKWVGLKHYKYLIFDSPYYSYFMRPATIKIIYSLPLILLISIVLGVLLNQKFRGRTFFRSVYFLPVIIATGVVIDLVFKTTGDISSSSSAESFSSNMISVEDIMKWLDFSGEIVVYIKTAISNIFNLVWSCGIQTVLIIAGLQSIPSSLYEVSRVEGASKWQQFWFVTIPMLSQVILLVIVFTIVDVFTDKRNPMIKQTYSQMSGGNYDETSAMLWIYLCVVAVTMGIILYLYRRCLMKRWE